MPRPKKWRRVCFLPQVCAFGPGCDGENTGTDCIQMTVDEFDVIRLKDHEGLSQDDIALRMDVGRSTVQRVYDEARRKIAECLVTGKPLRIAGGDYRLCEGENGPDRCGGRCCVRRRQQGT